MCQGGPSKASTNQGLGPSVFNQLLWQSYQRTLPLIENRLCFKVYLLVYFMCTRVCLSLFKSTTCMQCLQKPEKDVGSPRTEVIGSCELSSVAAGIRTQVLYENSKCSEAQSHLSSPSTCKSRKTRSIQGCRFFPHLVGAHGKKEANSSVLWVSGSNDLF